MTSEIQLDVVARVQLSGGSLRCWRQCGPPCRFIPTSDPFSPEERSSRVSCAAGGWAEPVCRMLLPEPGPGRVTTT